MAATMTRPAPIIAGTVAALLLLFGAYMGLHFLRSSRDIISQGEAVRLYYTDWEAFAFTPAAKLEGTITNEYILTMGPSGQMR